MEYSAFRKFSGKYIDEKVILEFYRSQRLNKHPENLMVYRLQCDDFLFGTDYEEYMYSIDFNDSELIYDDKLSGNEEIKYYTYEDKDIKEGKTYAYWIGCNDTSCISGPVLIRIRNKELWMPYKTMTNTMNKLKGYYDNLVHIQNHGKSVQGRDISSITIGNKDNIKLAFVGVIHAGESGPELMLYSIEKLLKNQSELLNKVGVSFLLNANPDERERLVNGVPWYLRENANGVDLNRNFKSGWDIVEYGYGFSSAEPTSPTYRGSYPESQPETKAVINFINYAQPDAVFAFHCLASICTDSFLVSKFSEGDSKYIDKCLKYLKPYTKGFNSKDKVDLYYGTSCGSMPHWLYKEYEIPAFDMELGPVDEKTRDQVIHDKVSIELMNKYKEKHYKGICEVLKYVYS